MKVNTIDASRTDSTAVGGTSKSRKADEAKYKEGGRADAGNAETAPVKSQISSRAKDMAKAKDVALRAPDVREDRVAELKSRIQKKQYHVSPEDIADKLLKEHLETLGVD